jgi:hypothetical protein
MSLMATMAAGRRGTCANVGGAVAQKRIPASPAVAQPRGPQLWAWSGRAPLSNTSDVDHLEDSPGF